MRFELNVGNCLLTYVCQCADDLSSGYTGELLLFFHHADQKINVFGVKDPTSNVGYGVMSNCVLHGDGGTYHVLLVL